MAAKQEWSFNKKGFKAKELFRAFTPEGKAIMNTRSRLLTATCCEHILEILQ